MMQEKEVLAIVERDSTRNACILSKDSYFFKKKLCDGLSSLGPEGQVFNEQLFY